MEKSPNVKCLMCGQECYVPKHRLSTFKYCSNSCKHKSNVIKITANCACCGNKFTHISSRCNKAKYCSRKCFYRSQIGRGETKYTCAHCDIEFYDSASHKRKFCSRKCVGKSVRANWHPSFMTVRKKMKKENMIQFCEICGYKEFPDILGVHHKDRNRKNNNQNNLLVVCPLCHSLIHHKHICH